ncbi:complex I NDUFA9 subunit family protein [Wolbachia endosymbiont of Brugia malayi]|uniref:complex I NDUFA9 subunit family protein n=1 Tax=Wolbachia endosymbiont of Brugia malayi TaxID=80849 RepID=UPI00004C92FB|nr:complex I NDUFA9 subunit family protein [Wolbachia endosymbiont of Brugia malayi]AAW70826.1 Nucleoside-diphosphate-sugar epimerase [Wolbachia endosymbiont strain TRS of Brugia malayi]QCB61792.1 complex I NDUFA9 subunit family protein [Wolbachia endosymbiont of Brugia malayi]
MIKRVVIFGGTGFIGKHIVRRLATAGYLIRVFVRNQEKAACLKLCGNLGQISIFKGDFFDEKLILESVEECNVVINLVGILYEVKEHSFYAVHVGIAEKIARAAKIKNVSMMIHFSAMGIENSKLSEYAQSKLKGEKAVTAAFPEAIIIKPSLVFGKEDNFFTKFARLATILPFLPLIGSGTTKFQPICVTDLAEMVYRIINLNKQDKKIYNIGGPKIYSFKSLLKFILNVTNRKCLLVNVSFPMAKLIAFFLESRIISILLKPITGDISPMLTRDQVRVMMSSSIEKSTDFEAIKIRPLSIENVVPEYLKVYKKY